VSTTGLPVVIYLKGEKVSGTNIDGSKCHIDFENAADHDRVSITANQVATEATIGSILGKQVIVMNVDKTGFDVTCVSNYNDGFNTTSTRRCATINFIVFGEQN